MKFGLLVVSVVLFGGLAACANEPQRVPPTIVDANSNDWQEVPGQSEVDLATASNNDDSSSSNPVRRVVKLKPKRTTAPNKPIAAASASTAASAAGSVQEPKTTEAASTTEAAAETSTPTPATTAAVTSETVSANANPIDVSESASTTTVAMVNTLETDAENELEELPDDEKTVLGSDDTVAKEADADGDSVLDAEDSCPESVTNLPIDNEGCVTLQGFIDGIEFEPGTSTLTLQANSVLNGIAQTMKTQNDLRLSVVTHVDASENSTVGVQVSKRRTLAVIRYLISQTISGSRIRPGSAPTSETGDASRSGVEFRTLAN